MKYVYTPEVTASTIFTIVGNPWALPVIWLVGTNVLSFALMGIDKGRAKREGKRRIPERTLFLAAALGGSIGSIAGMRAFRHKTRHWYFVWGMPAILALQLALAAWVALFR